MMMTMLMVIIIICIAGCPDHCSICTMTSSAPSVTEIVNADNWYPLEVNLLIRSAHLSFRGVQCICPSLICWNTVGHILKQIASQNMHTVTRQMSISKHWRTSLSEDAVECMNQKSGQGYSVPSIEQHSQISTAACSDLFWNSRKCTLWLMKSCCCCDIAKNDGKI